MLRKTHRSGDTSLKVSLFSGFTCDRSDAVRTNCPTQLENLGLLSAVVRER